jgi:ATP-dependent helicase/nuclease subunit B
MEVVRYGPGAVEALRGQITRAQADDPLAPVLVVVTRPSVGLALRRALATTPPGVVNVGFVTLAQLADQIGGPVLAAAGRQPAPPAVVHAAVRAALAQAGDPLVPARLHPATERAMAGVVRDLEGCGPDVLARLRRLGPRPAAVADVVVEVRRRLADWYDPADAAQAAIGVLGQPGAGAVAARVVVHLPQVVGPAHRRLVRALAEVVPVVVLLGATGDPAADQPTVALARQLAPGQPDPVLPDGDVLGGTRVLSAPSADSEVLLAVRGVMDHHRAGIPLERMAVVHGGLDPYPRILHESFAQAGIPTNGPGVRALSATVAGRTLLGALALPDHDWRRDEVVAWLAGAPIRLVAGAPATVPATRWDELSRRAGVTAGAEAWLEHLDRRSVELEARVAELVVHPGHGDDPHDDDNDQRRDRYQRELHQLGELRAFLVELADRLEPAAGPSSWAGWSRWADQFLRRYLRTGDWWPDDETQALTEVVDLLARLSILDRVDPDPDLATFRRALESDLSGPAPRTARFGHGVLVGPIDSVVGLDLDVVFVVGMIEGAFPTRVRDDALLPDEERSAAGDDVPRRADGGLLARRTYLAALASAPVRVLSYARGDQRRGREQRPSPWLLETLSRQVGRRLFSRDVDQLGSGPDFDWVPSLTAAVRSPLEPASVADRDLRSLLRWFDRHGSLDDHPLVAADPVLRLGMLARHQRRAPGFTRFDGLVERVDAPSPLAGRALSPTSLEHYAACPRSYFFASVLWIHIPQRPEDVQRISAMDRGNVVHAVLERFIDEQVHRPRDERIQPAQAWSAADRRRLDEISATVFDEFEQRGLTGRDLLWELDQVSIRRDLHAFLDADDRYRAETGMVPERAELHFGPDDGTPVEVHLPGGRRLEFKGSADRVDLSDGGSLVVLDYKTGSKEAFRDIERGEDPTVRGTKLQLPIYGLAARNRVGGAAVAAAYWFVSQRGNFERISYPLDPPGLDRFEHVVEVITDGIEAGAFPGRPGEETTRFGHSFENCKYCDFDAICPTDRDRGWSRVRGAPQLATYVAMAEGDDAAPGADS